jgi:DNA-binding transcriptional ArsR family regulator
MIDQRLVRSLVHPLRAEILDLLTERVLSPNQITGIVGRPLSHVSYHVRTLEKLGAVELVDLAQRRGATEHFYRAVPDAFIGNPVWRRVPKTLRRAVSGASLQSFIDKAVRAFQEGKLEQDNATFIWLPLPVDEEGKQEIAGIGTATIETLRKVQKNSARRLARSGGKPTQYIVGVYGVEAAGGS